MKVETRDGQHLFDIQASVPFHRDLLVSMTFGVVIFSILVHGLTLSPLLRRLGIVRGTRGRRRARVHPRQVTGSQRRIARA